MAASTSPQLIRSNRSNFHSTTCETASSETAMAFKTKSVAELGEWLKEEGFSDEVVHIFEGSTLCF